MNSVISLDVGGTSVKSGVVCDGVVLGEVLHTPLNSQGSAASILETFAQIVQTHLATLGDKDWLGIGFGFPSPFDYATGVALIQGVEKYESIYGMNIGQELRQRVPAIGQRPIRFRNDAEAAILGEYFFGAGKPYNRVLGITLGTGLGSSFVVDGVRLTTGTGIPTEGFLFPEPVGNLRADDVFSKRGLEKRLSAAGLVPDIATAAEAARQGDPRAQVVFATFGSALGVFLAGYAVPFGAEAVLVLGGIAGAFDLFGATMALDVPVLPSLLGNKAALLGAAKLLI